MFNNLVGIIGSVSCITALTMIRGRDTIGRGLLLAFVIWIIAMVAYFISKNNEK